MVVISQISVSTSSKNPKTSCLERNIDLMDQVNYGEGDNGFSLPWHYVDDRHNYHVRVPIHMKSIWLDLIGVFHRVYFLIYMDVYYC